MASFGFWSHKIRRSLDHIFCATKFSLTAVGTKSSSNNVDLHSECSWPLGVAKVSHLHPRLSLARFWPPLMSLQVTLFNACLPLLSCCSRSQECLHFQSVSFHKRGRRVELVVSCFVCFTPHELNCILSQVTPSPSRPTSPFFSRHSPLGTLPRNTSSGRSPRSQIARAIAYF